MNTPMISVVMPVYNGEKFLRLAVDSILNQTVSDFEFIIIDDGSTDQTAAILDSYTDPRIVRITHSNNYGLSRSLNDGIASAQRKYIARMDADDISLPERFEKQIEFMETHPDIGVCGTWRKNINYEGKVIKGRMPPTTNERILWDLCFQRVSLTHPSIMMRKELCEMVGMYDEQYRVAQDYDLWRKLSKVTKFANIPEFLLYYRVHGTNITVSCNSLSKQESDKIASETMNEICEISSGDLYYKDSPKDNQLITTQVKIIQLALKKFIALRHPHKIDQKILRQDAGRMITQKTRPFITRHPVALYLYLLGRVWRTL